jgi:hypothetical protein
MDQSINSRAYLPAIRFGNVSNKLVFHLFHRSFRVSTGSSRGCTRVPNVIKLCRSCSIFASSNFRLAASSSSNVIDDDGDGDDATPSDDVAVVCVAIGVTVAVAAVVDVIGVVDEGVVLFQLFHNIHIKYQQLGLISLGQVTAYRLCDDNDNDVLLME